ncbi:MAG: hypothetical protein ABSF29_12865 [Tepidisphaeraceae bacterium]|jgi:hypothetical protein
MPKFKDSAGTEWSIVLNLGAIDRVFSETGFHLPWLFTSDQRAAQIETKLFAVFWCLCEPQAQRAGISRDQFGERICDLDVAQAATEALKEALINFSPSRLRPALKKVTEITGRLYNGILDQAAAGVINLPEVGEPSISSSREPSSGSAGNTAESLASTPGH